MQKKTEFNRDDTVHAVAVIINISVGVQRAIASQPNTRFF
jgi:hypothetical protein